MAQRGKKNIEKQAGHDPIEVYRHSTSHVMAHAVKMFYPDAKLGIGPPIEDGFYYDFDLDTAITPDDLKKIEQKMAEIVKEDYPFEREEINSEEAMRLFQEHGEDYKAELIKDLGAETVSIYRHNGFVDLCKGPHLPSTGQIKAFKLLSVAGAYWRGNEKNKMLQRIYGTAFENEAELAEYLDRLEEAKRRDHRVLGRDLDLFSIHEEAGAGLVHWHPKGAAVRNVIEEFWRREHLKRGYQLVYGPHIARLDLWKRSGHWEFYREYMYSPMEIDENEYIVRPMNCPSHILMFKTKVRSYRDLPLRWAELGTVYRYERSGVLHGMMRVRGFTQDDAHIFCTPEQVREEVAGVINLALFMMELFGFRYEIALSTRPEKYVGSEENWEKATEALKEALSDQQMDYHVEPGEGVFYGPKIDVKLIDALGRGWQGPTIQVDFNFPERFDVNYIGSDGAKHRVVMIHRTVLGSMERFIGVLIEHYGGAFPVWLSPAQVRLIPIQEEHVEYARGIFVRMLENNIRVDMDARNEKIGLRIREGETQKIPYMLVIGEKEVSSGKVAVRKRRAGDQGQVDAEEFIQQLLKEIQERR